MPKSLRVRVPGRLRDNVHARALAVGLGVIPPRTMHSPADVRILLEAAAGARRVVEIGVYEGSSALALCRELDRESELHLIDPFGEHPDALPRGWGANEWATRRILARAAARRGGPRLSWHIALSHEVSAEWTEPVDLLFIDGDHSEQGCALDWSDWHSFVPPGGQVVFHDARESRPGGRGLPGPTAVVDRLFRGPEAVAGWEIAAEADRTVALRRV